MKPKHLLPLTMLLVMTAPLAHAGEDRLSATADQDRLSAKIEAARECLSYVTSLRGSDAFRRWGMSRLARQLASDIDYAQTWAPLDAVRAESYAAGAADCDGSISAWVATQQPRREHYPHAAAATPAEGQRVAMAAEAQRAADNRQRVVQMLSGQGLVHRAGFIQQTAGWPSPEERHWRQVR